MVAKKRIWEQTMASDDLPRKRLNTDQKRALKAASVKKFVQQYGRKSNKRGGLDPNDRTYSGDIEKSVKRMRPDELDRLLRDDEE